MKRVINQQIIDKYILDEFGKISNPLTEEEIKGLISNDKLTLEGVKLWYLFGGDLNINDNYGKTILHVASWMGQLDIVEYVLDKGVDVDCLNDNNSTPLIFATYKGHLEVIDLLLKGRVNINHQNKWGLSSLHYVCGWNYLEIVKLLVEHNIDIHLKGNLYNEDETALDIAKAKGYQEIVEYLKSVIKE